MQAILDHRQSEDTSVFPKFEVLITRKFEVTELCGMFLGRWSKYIYLLLIIVTSFLYCITSSAVVGSSWAVNLPLNFSDVDKCNSTDFHFHTLPIVVPCRNAYWFCLFLFGCIVVPFSMVKLREQAIVQVTLSFFRFITITAILIFCITNLIATETICNCKQPWQHYPNATEDFEDSDTECTVNSTSANIALRFSLEEWTESIPLIVTAFTIHQGIPFLTHPVKQKKQLVTLISSLYIVMTLIYMMVGEVVSMWWKDCIIETCTLNWVSWKLWKLKVKNSLILDNHDNGYYE